MAPPWAPPQRSYYRSAGGSPSPPPAEGKQGKSCESVCDQAGAQAPRRHGGPLASLAKPPFLRLPPGDSPAWLPGLPALSAQFSQAAYVCAPAQGVSAAVPAPLALRAPPGLFAHSASPLAPGPLPLRGSAPGRRARRRYAAPPLAGPPPAGSPRLPRAPRVRACALRGARCSRKAWASPLYAAGFLRYAPGALAPFGGAPAFCVWRRVPQPASPSGLRGRLGSAAGRKGGKAALLVRFAPSGFHARVLAPAALPFPGSAAEAGGFSPAPLPSPPPTLGAPGKREAFSRAPPPAAVPARVPPWIGGACRASSPAQLILAAM